MNLVMLISTFFINLEPNWMIAKFKIAAVVATCEAGLVQPQCI